jgi:Planctomycete cytochrome C
MTKQTDRIRQIALAACCAAALVAGACGGSSSSPAAPSAPAATPSTGSGGGTGSTEVTLSSLSSQIFVPRCTGCHGGGSPSAGMNLEPGNAYEKLVNVASSEKSGAIRVIPGDPENSYLVQKLRGDVGIVGLRMPRNGPPYLTDDQINLVKQWIQAGAKNN